METVADRVIVELFAKLDGYDAAVNASRAKFERNMAAQMRSARAAERQIKASADSIRATLLRSSSVIAGAFGANEIKNLADSYTRFTNSLKTAGKEGAALTRTQDALFAQAQRYGVDLEKLGELYGGLSTLQKDLNATDTETLQLTQAVAAGLKVKGGTAEQAAGALLGLNQALAQTRVQTDEYNQILDGLRPLLQAAVAGSEKYRGSLAKLKQDIEAGNVGGQDLFRLILNGYDAITRKAEKAQLTIAASFTVLNNALGRYIGQTDDALSATERLSQAIVGIANNLDTIVPALAGIGAAFATRFALAKGFSAASAGLARMTGAEREVADAVLKGNASYVSRTRLEAARAQLASRAAAAEVAAIEATVTALRQEQAQLQANLALIERQRAESLQAQAAMRANAAAGFGALGMGGATADAARANQDLKAQLVTKRALEGVNARLAASEAQLATAQTAAAGAAAASAAAVTRVGLAARLAAAASGLFAGTLSALAGALPLIAIGALVTAIISYNQRIRDADANTKAINERARELAASAREAATQGRSAASAIGQVGSSAEANSGKVARFAGAVGDLAENLRQVAEQRRKAKLDDLKSQEESAKSELEAARQNPRFRPGGRLQFDLGRLGDTATLGRALAGRLNDLTPEEKAANAAVVQAQKNLAEIRQRRVALEKADLATEIRDSDRTGGRNLKGELDRLQADLLVARKRGAKEEINDLEAEVYERKRTLKLMKDGSSFEAASAQARREAARLREAGAERIATAADAKADRAAAAAARRDAAGELDAARRDSRNAGEIAQAEADLIDARQSIAASAEERARLELQRIEADRQARAAEIANANRDRNIEIGNKGPGGTGQFSAAEVSELQAANDAAARRLIELNDQAATLRVQSVLFREAERTAAEQLDVQVSSVERQRDLLQAQQALADSADERRDLALRLIDLQYQQERLELEAIIASREATDAQKEIAKARLAILGQLESAARQGVIRDTENALERYSRETNRSAGQTRELNAEAAVNGIEALGDGIRRAAIEFENLGDVAHSVITTIASDLLDMQIERYITGPLSGLANGALNGPSFNPTGLDPRTLGTSVTAALGTGAPSPEATAVTGLGDAATAAATAITGNTVPALAQQAVSTLTQTAADSAATAALGGLTAAATFASAALQAMASQQTASTFAGLGAAGFAQGGVISGPGTGTSDSMLARVSNGEGILTARTVRRIGAKAVDDLNAGRIPRFASGGIVSASGGRSVRPMGAPAASPARIAAGQGARINQVRIGQMVFPNVTNAREARATMKQARSALFADGAKTRRQGIG